MPSLNGKIPIRPPWVNSTAATISDHFHRWISFPWSTEKRSNGAPCIKSHTTFGLRRLIIRVEKIRSKKMGTSEQKVTEIKRIMLSITIQCHFFFCYSHRTVFNIVRVKVGQKNRLDTYNWPNGKGVGKKMVKNGWNCNSELVLVEFPHAVPLDKVPWNISQRNENKNDANSGRGSKFMTRFWNLFSCILDSHMHPFIIYDVL